MPRGKIRQQDSGSGQLHHFVRFWLVPRKVSRVSTVATALPRDAIEVEGHHTLRGLVSNPSRC